MIKLKDILGEQYGGRRGKFYRGSRYNDEPFDFRDDKPSRPKLPVPPEWDKLMDRVNNDPRFETYTGDDGFQIIDKNGRNLKWQITPGRYGWKGMGRSGVDYPNPVEFFDVKDVIKNFYELTGLSDNESDTSEPVIGDDVK